LDFFFGHSSFAVLLAEECPLLLELFPLCGMIKAHFSFSLSISGFVERGKNQKPMGENGSRGRCACMPCSCLLSKNGQQKRPGAN
jgi:hypothetical protein